MFPSLSPVRPSVSVAFQDLGRAKRLKRPNAFMMSNVIIINVCKLRMGLRDYYS